MDAADDAPSVDQDLPPSRLLTANDAQQFKHGRRLDMAHLASGQGSRHSRFVRSIELNSGCLQESSRLIRGVLNWDS